MTAKSVLMCPKACPRGACHPCYATAYGAKTPLASSCP